MAVTLLWLACGCQITEQEDLLSVRRAEPGAISYIPTVTPSSSRTAPTKGDLINDNGDGDPVEFDTSSEFYVSAWDLAGASSSRTIPASGETGTFRKVRYFTTDLTPDGPDDDKVYRNGWNTVAPGNDSRIVEYMWLSESRTEAGVSVTHGIEKAFYAYANLPAGSSSPSVSVNGTTHLPTSMTLGYEEPSDVSAQTDILVAYYRGEGDTSGKPTGTASLQFLHPLASVRLVLGTVKGVNVFSINSVSLESVHSGGTLAMTPTGTGSGVTIGWTPYTGSGSKKSITQTVNLNVTSVTEPGTEIGEPFIVIPQDFTTSPARIAVNITADGRTFDIYRTLDPAHWTPEQLLSSATEWEAGTSYTYAFNYNGHEGIQLWENGPFWAPKNVGAVKPEDAGWYFSWGNVKGYVPVDVTNSPTDNCRWVEALNPSTELSGGFCSSSYGTQGPGASLDTDIPVDETYDAALAVNGTKWRIPTADELNGLCVNTDYNVTTRNGVLGIRFNGRGEYSDRFIFLPYCGTGSGKALRLDDGSYYCSSSECGPVSGFQGTSSLRLFYRDVPGGTDIVEAQMRENLRMNGCVIRPVENTAYVEDITE